KSLHAENAAASFFEFGRIYHDWGQALLAENCVQVSSPVGRNVPSVGYNSVANELVGLVGCQLVDPLPVFRQHVEGAPRKRVRIDEDGLVVQWAKAGVEVIAIGIRQPQGND